VRFFFLLDNLRKQCPRRVPLTPALLFSKLSAQCAVKVFGRQNLFSGDNWRQKNRRPRPDSFLLVSVGGLQNLNPVEEHG
jgi:hypothetical protein